MAGLNYSKWDNLDSDDEEAASKPKAEEDDNEEEEEDSDDEDDDDEEEEEEEEDSEEESEELLKEKAEAKKAEGNVFFKKKDYVGAIRFYTQAINLYPTEVYYSNRAAAYVSLKQWERAKNDADTCIRLNSKFNKGYLHRAKAQANVSRALYNPYEWCSDRFTFAAWRFQELHQDDPGRDGEVPGVGVEEKVHCSRTGDPKIV
jgi:tetratricopeptide (TPR) repeat protein